MKVIRDIELMLILLLLTACSSDGDSSEAQQPSVLNIYVYSPDKPMVTRSDVGSVTPIDNILSESLITSLQIWVFDHSTGDLVAYYSPESVDNLNGTTTGVTYQLSVSEAFAQAAQTANKPRVDVYVLANAASCGLTSYGETTTRDILEDALIGSAYFGLAELTTEVPEAGLPMSGVLRNVQIDGISPVYRLLNQNVKLTRAVSKIRFVFCRETPAQDQTDVSVQIKSVKLNAGMIPLQEYLFLGSLEMEKPYPVYHVGNFGTNDAKEFLPVNSNHEVQTLTDIPKNDDPLLYVYQAQGAQDYEDLIAEGVTNNELKQLGPFYLRESDKNLSGIIKYQKQGDVEKPATFEMDAAGDFSRNHTWIVYAYYSKSGLVAVNVVVRDWDEDSSSHEVYNW